MTRRIKVAQFGLGPIGVECLKLVATKEWARIVGAIDVAPDKLGQNLGDLTGSKSLRGLNVARSIDDLKETPDLIFQTTVSRLPAALQQLDPLVRKGIHVVSSCEELIYPQLREPELAINFDRICRQRGARVVGTGVNPGFVMDLLPLCLTGVTGELKAIHIERVVNASTRREPLQRKIGSGMAPKQFRRLLRSGQAGHAGLNESLVLIAHALGQRTKRIIETSDAIVAEKDIQTKYLTVRKGQTCGLHQRAELRANSGFLVTLDLKMYLDADDPHDAVRIEGDPPLDVLIRGGVAGDPATVAALVNTAPRLLRAEPGLRLITELPIV